MIGLVVSSLVFLSHAWAIPQGSFIPRLIATAYELQKLEHQKLICEYEIRTLRANEKQTEKLILNRFPELFRMARLTTSFERASNLITAFFTHQHTDLIRGIILARYLIPQLRTQREALHKHLDELQKAGKERANKETRMRDLTTTHEKYLRHHNDLLADKAHHKRLMFKKRSLFLGQTPQHIGEALRALEVFFETTLLPSQNQVLDIRQPVVGNIIKDPTKPMAACLQTSCDTTVVSPWHGVLAYTCFLPGKGQALFIKQDRFYLILVGLGSVTCREGEELTPGEPIGRTLPSADSLSHQPILELYVYDKERAVNPFPYLRTLSFS